MIECPLFTYNVSGGMIIVVSFAVVYFYKRRSTCSLYKTYREMVLSIWNMMSRSTTVSDQYLSCSCKENALPPFVRFLNFINFSIISAHLKTDDRHVIEVMSV